MEQAVGRGGASIRGASSGARKWKSNLHDAGVMQVGVADAGVCRTDGMEGFEEPARYLTFGKCV